MAAVEPISLKLVSVDVTEDDARDGRAEDESNVEDVEDVEDVKDVEDVENVEDVKDVENVEDVKDVEDVEDNMDGGSDMSSHISEEDQRQVLTMLRSIKSHLECKRCHHPFQTVLATDGEEEQREDRAVPMLLPCRHTQCSICCSSYASSAGRSREGRQNSGDHGNDSDEVDRNIVDNVNSLSFDDEQVVDTVHCSQHEEKKQRSLLERMLFRKQRKANVDSNGSDNGTTVETSVRSGSDSVGVANGDVEGSNRNDSHGKSNFNYPRERVVMNRTLESSLLVNLDFMETSSVVLPDEQESTVPFHRYISSCINILQNESLENDDAKSQQRLAVMELTSFLCEKADEVLLGNIICYICFSICDDVCALSCGHAYCRDCLMVHFTTNSLGTVSQKRRWQRTNCVDIGDCDELECPLCRVQFVGQEQIHDCLYGVDIQTQDLCDSMIALSLLLDKWRRSSWIHVEQAIIGVSAPQNSKGSVEDFGHHRNPSASELGTASFDILRQADGYLPFFQHRSKQDLNLLVTKQIHKLFRKSVFNASLKKIQPEIVNVDKYYVPFHVLRVCVTADTRIDLKNKVKKRRTVIQEQSVALQRRIIRCAISKLSLPWLPKYLRDSIDQIGPWPLSDQLCAIDDEFIRNYGHSVPFDEQLKYSTGQILFDKKVKRTVRNHINKHASMIKVNVNSRVGTKHCPEAWENIATQDEELASILVEPGLSRDRDSNETRSPGHESAEYITDIKTRIHKPELVSSRLVLLPMIHVEYSYDRRHYHIVLNGTNMDIMRGKAPKSAKCILLGAAGSIAMTGVLALHPATVPMACIGAAVGIQYGIKQHRDNMYQRGHKYVL